MNTFWGCETEELTELSTRFDARALRLRALFQQIALVVRLMDWFGPDAEDHRLRTDDLVGTVLELVERLRALGELLEKEAQEQDACSQADGAPFQVGDPLGGRAVPPWSFEGSYHGPLLSGPGEEDRLPISGPLASEEPWRFPAPGSLPEGEDFALDTEKLPAAERVRRTLLAEVPGADIAQMLPGAHEEIGEIFDQVEQGLEDNGYGAFVPAVSLARIPHDISGVAIGEDSVLVQTIDSIDRGVANMIQTGEEVATEIGEGDLSGAVRAAERGAYRHAGVVADLLTTTPGPAVASSTSDLLGTGADLVEPFSPDAARTLRGAEESVRRSGQAWKDAQEQFTDPEIYYNLRRAAAPMPWDPQE